MKSINQNGLKNGGSFRLIVRLSPDKTLIPSIRHVVQCRLEGL